MSLTAWVRRVRSRRAVLPIVLFTLVALAVPAALPVAPAHSQTHAQTHALMA